MQVPANRSPGCAAALLLASLLPASAGWCQPPPAGEAGGHAQRAARSPYLRAATSSRAVAFYARRYGVGRVRAQRTASGSLIRVTYRVLDPRLAAPIADQKATPYLYDQRSHALLRVPSLENVGDLRQARELQSDQDYWLAFSNKGNLVRAGDRVDLIVGTLRIEGVMVE